MSKSYTSSTQTRLRILHSAVDLFNERGTANVSTNHIAETAGISPGNLYYHFKNKAAIIRAIFELMVEDWEVMYAAPDGVSFQLENLRGLFKLGAELVWKYRFFYREQVALLRDDAELAARHHTIIEQRLAGQIALARQLAALGLVRMPDDETELHNLLTAVWIINTYWLIFLETRGITPDDAEIERGAALAFQLFAPYVITDAKMR